MRILSVSAFVQRDYSLPYVKSLKHQAAKFRDSSCRVDVDWPHEDRFHEEQLDKSASEKTGVGVWD